MPERIWIQLPQPSTTTIVLLIAVLIGLFALAVGTELWRQRQLRQRRIRAEWKTAEEILADRDLTETERQYVRAMVQRWSADDPLKPFTLRAHFNHCVELEMERLSGGGNDKAFAEAGVILRDARERLGLDVVPFGYPIRTTRDLHGGQTINLAEGSGAANAAWQSFIVDRINEAYIFARHKDHDAKAEPRYEPGAELRCHLWREEDARYTFAVKFVKREPETGLYMFLHASELKRHQAREHFRIHYDETVSVGVLNAPVDGNFDDVAARKPFTQMRARVTSLSAGGLAVVFQQPLPRQVMLRLALNLNGADTVVVNAEIVATHAVSGGRSLVRVRFVGIDEETEDKIARFVMMRQQPLVAAAAASHSE